MFLGRKSSRLNFKRDNAQILTMSKHELTGQRWRTCHVSLQTTNERKDRGREAERGKGGENKRETRRKGDRVSDGDGRIGKKHRKGERQTKLEETGVDSMLETPNAQKQNPLDTQYSNMKPQYTQTPNPPKLQTPVPFPNLPDSPPKRYFVITFPPL